MDADGSNHRFLRTKVMTPVWSPDGEQILFLNFADLIGSQGHRALATMPPSGDPATPLHLAAFVYPDWGTAPLLTGDVDADPALRPQCSNARDDDDGRIDAADAPA